MNIECPHCHRTGKLPDGLAIPHKVRCPKCKTVFTLSHTSHLSCDKTHDPRSSGDAGERIGASPGEATHERNSSALPADAETAATSAGKREMRRRFTSPKATWISAIASMSLLVIATLFLFIRAENRRFSAHEAKSDRRDRSIAAGVQTDERTTSTGTHESVAQAPNKVVTNGTVIVTPAHVNSRDLLKQAVEIVRTARDAESEQATFNNVIEPKLQRPWAMHELAVALARAGDFSSAQRVLSEMETGPPGDAWFIGIPLDNARGNIAVVHANAGNLPNALAMVRAMKHDDQRVFALTEMARAMQNKSDKLMVAQTFRIAIDYAKAITSEGTRDFQLEQIASTMAFVGEIEMARTTARQIRSIKAQDVNVVIGSSYALHQADSGDWRGALETLASVPPWSLHAGPAWQAVVERLAKEGRFDNALAVLDGWSMANGLENHLNSISARCTIAVEQSKRGLRVQSQETLRKAVKLTNNALLVDRVGETYAECGEIAVAKALSDAIKSRDAIYKAPLLRAIARAEVKAGDWASARASFSEAILVASKIRDSRALLSEFRSSAKDRVLLEDSYQALEWAKELTSPYARAYAFLGIAEGLLLTESVR